MGATRAFLAELDRYTLADLSARPLPVVRGKASSRSASDRAGAIAWV
ncbi:MAG: hypothetical protein ACSLFJ_06845 [Immundisolibacter sp.]